MSLKWNVFYYDINKRKMEIWNVFQHCKFLEYVQKALKKFKTKEEFEKQLRKELFYYYCSKSEWEIIVSPWVGGDREKDSVKIDVYDQVMLNWEVFVDYVWSNKKEILKVSL